MNESMAKEILGWRILPTILGKSWMQWYIVDGKITLCNTFTADELEAIAWWMRNKEGNNATQEVQ